MFGGFDVTDLIFGILGLYEAVCGLATLATGKVYGQGRNIAAKYTEESIRAAAPMQAIGRILIGLALIGSGIGGIIPSLAALKKYEMPILIVGAVLGLVFILLGRRKMVEKKKN